MKKQNENLFFEKFRILNTQSQDHAEDIKWSSTSSSESESTCYNDKILTDRRYGKRKRKKNVLKNMSNLDITVIKSCKNQKSDIDVEKSPILKSNHVTSFMSPVLTTTRFPLNRETDTISPVLSAKRLCRKSPVLSTRNASPNFSGRVRKKLCYDKHTYQEQNNSTKYVNLCSDVDVSSNSDRIHGVISQNDECMQSKSIIEMVNDSDSSSKSNLMIKVKDFFDSHFSSEHTSQNIDTTDTPTPSDCSKNEDVDILSCKTQTVAYLNITKHESASNSNSVQNASHIKKFKYKRGGLAFRLNALIKKQNAHISLWQHERFLASNSNFVIPKEENIVFRIRKIDFNYGCYLLYAVDMDDKKYLILINKIYVNAGISDDSIFKLYEPYKIISIDLDVKVIVNVSKFECILLKK